MPLLAAEPSQWPSLAALLLCKAVFGMVGGALLDIPLRHVLPKSLYGGYAGHADEVDCHEEHEEHSGIWLAALRHTLEIFVFILLFSLLLGLVFESVGEEAISSALAGMGILQPMLTALVGLVPNCAASVLLAQLYMEGAISFGSLFAGLTAGAGVGLAVLWRGQSQLETESVYDRPAVGGRRGSRHAAASGCVKNTRNCGNDTIREETAMQYTIENDILRLTVDSLGAEVVSVIHKPTGAEMMWSGDPAVWGRHAPILFPYTGKLTDGKMIAKGVEYQGAQHGFAGTWSIR